MPIHDLRCASCGTESPDVWVVAGSYPPCAKCGGAQSWIPSRVNADIWGGPRRVESLDMTFDSKSDLRSHLKANGWEPAGDRVGGAREEKFQKRLYSYGGQGNRTA